jgi:tetratricopeptide (TPR) repeat protein
MFVRERTIRCSELLLTALFLVPPLELAAQGPQQRLLTPRQFHHEMLSATARVADGYYRRGVEDLREPSNSDRAIEYLERAVDLDGTNAEYHYMLAEAYMANYQLAGIVRMPFIAPKVRTHLELAVKYSPLTIEYHEALVQYYVLAPAILGGSYAKAHGEANEIAKLDPYLGLLARAGIYAEEGEESKSLAAYDKAIRMRPAAWQAYRRLGSHHLDNQEIDKALEMFRQYVRVAPDQAESHNHLGRAYQRKRMYTEAIDAFMKALDKDPSMSPLVFRIAQLYEFQGNKLQAREYYHRYLTMVPSGKAADDARVKVKELVR